MKIVCTGSAGFIGSHLTDRLIKDGHEVHVIDDLSNGRRENVDEDRIGSFLWHTVESDAARWLVVDEVKPDVVFHLAALGSVPFSVAHPDKTYQANVAGTANMLDAARQVGARFVFASSASYYGDDEMVGEFGPVQKVESLPPKPLNHYGASKVIGELWGNAFHRMHGLEFVALRFFNVFGPRQRADSQYAAVVPKFIQAALYGNPLELHGGGVQTRDLTYVDNVVDACVVAGTAYADKVAGQAFNVCGGDRVSIRDLASEIGLHVVGGYSSDVDGDIGMLRLRATPPRPGDIRDSFGSHVKLTNATGWEPKVDWHEGIRQTVEWFKEQQ